MLALLSWSFGLIIITGARKKREEERLRKQQEHQEMMRAETWETLKKWGIDLSREQSDSLTNATNGEWEDSYLGTDREEELLNIPGITKDKLELMARFKRLQRSIARRSDYNSEDEGYCV